VVRHIKIVQEKVETSKNVEIKRSSTGKPLEVSISDKDLKNAVKNVSKSIPDVAGNPLDFPTVGHIGGMLSGLARSTDGKQRKVYAERSRGKKVGWFKTKYYGNKVAGKIIDSIANQLPAPIKAITGYAKDSVQNATMNEEEKTKETAKDFGVDEKSAENYNKMNAIEDREKKLNAVKSTIPTSGLTKPFDFVLNQMGVSVKKIIASDYGWEYREAMKRAMMYKKAGLKYREIIQNTVKDMEEMYGTDHRTYLLDRNSKEGYRNQEARVRVYLEQLFEERQI